MLFLSLILEADQVQRMETLRQELTDLAAHLSPSWGKVLCFVFKRTDLEIVTLNPDDLICL